jgi:hypothetical protein
MGSTPGDTVLSVLVDTLEKNNRRLRRDRGGPKFANFVRAVEKGWRGEWKEVNVGHIASDWQLPADVRDRMQYPSAITVTKEPDIVMWSLLSKQAVMVDLTIPWDERIEEAYE